MTATRKPSSAGWRASMFHAPAYSVLVKRITATDRLIDEVVYRLYGLTEVEIAVVEGE